MGSCCGNAENWFAAAQYGRCEYLRRNKLAFTQRYDDGGQIECPFRFKGFTAIHYAAYFGHLDAAMFLIPYEFAMVTREPATLIVATCDGVCEGIEAPAGLGVLQLSILGNAAQVTDALFEKFQQYTSDEDKKMKIEQPKNALFTILCCQIMNGNADQFELISKYHQCYLEKDAKLMFHQGVNPLLLAVYIGRKEYVELILELSQSKQYGKFYRVFVENQNYCRWDLTAWQLIPEKLIAPKEQIQDCLKIVHRFNVKRREAIPEWMGGTHEHRAFSMAEYTHPHDVQCPFDIANMGDVKQFDMLCGDNAAQSFSLDVGRKDSNNMRRSMNPSLSRKSSSAHSSMDHGIRRSRSPQSIRALRKSLDAEDDTMVVANDNN